MRLILFLPFFVVKILHIANDFAVTATEVLLAALGWGEGLDTGCPKLERKGG